MPRVRCLFWKKQPLSKQGVARGCCSVQRLCEAKNGGIAFDVASAAQVPEYDRIQNEKAFNRAKRKQIAYGSAGRAFK
jgi:hypothetical protein